ncbi:MAG TPA: PEP-CTERM sorting domain-containing protein [Gammaproteobacteria bacterium]|nr:PEP-CTERM sorting domain-containing protein [Gammaproteobacteria bacterium]
MKFPDLSRLRWWGVSGFAAMMLAATMAAPAFAGPTTTLTLSGEVDNVTTTSGSTPIFGVGDPLSGTLVVNLGADGTFTLDDLQSFALSLGDDAFGMAGANFGSLSGTVSGSSLTEFELAVFFNQGNDNPLDDVGFGFNMPDQPFSATGGNAIATGSFMVSVSTGGGGGVAVPEPPVWLMFGLGLAAVGFAMRRRRNAAD